MASIRQQGDRFEIRECESSPVGPRQRALARFQRILTPEILDRAAALARRPFDRERLIARARARGIPVTEIRRTNEARRLLSFLRQGGQVNPVIVVLLREALASMEAREVPEHLEDAVDWLGRSEFARGRALRGLLRTASRVARSRGPVREPACERFPRFSSDNTDNTDTTPLAELSAFPEVEPV
jgi:hypothetical protein